VTQPQPLLKHAGDIGATIASAFVAVSHWAELATPILSFVIALATCVWWAIRFREWYRTGKLGD
jgi:hypothetical protein